MLATAWYVIRYYIRCLRLASTGALDKANAWSWILGIIPLALAGWYWDIGALRIPDTPRDFIVFMVVTVVLSLMLVFLVRLVFAPAILAQELEKDRDELRGQLVPKINFFLEGLGPGGSVPVAPTQGGSDSKWVQLAVSCKTGTPLVQAEVWLTSVRRIKKDLHGNETEGDDLVEEPIRCTWSQENNEVTLDVRPLITRRANLFALVDFTPFVIQPCTRPPKIRLSNEITKPGKYRITAVATAHGVPSVRGAFVFEWKDFQNVWLNVS